MKPPEIRKVIASVMAISVAAAFSLPSAANAENTAVSNITVTPSEHIRPISPYIFGVNSGVDLTAASPQSLRLGGNRFSAYNWENNMSNAGSDYYHTSDKYLTNSLPEEYWNTPGGPALAASAQAKQYNIPYTMLTLQMLGYASSSRSGRVDEAEIAPSEKWVKVENRKGSAFTLEPDFKDGVIYMDEYLNYLKETIGDSGSGGIRGYALDNEPALWHHTHARVQTSPLTATQIIDKSADLASVVKTIDPGAEVFGPALFGYSAFVDFTNTSDWKRFKAENNYRWFIDYYLDAMNKAGETAGQRLLDVLDIHFYTEAKGACGQRSCNHYDNDGCIQARLDSVRALYDPDYRENSWIADTGAAFFPLLPNVQKSIDEYYPGTKIAFGEYNFGGGDHISGAVAQADMFGIFAEYGVYFSTLWAFENNQYQLSAINMFTNYDGQGSGFGDTLVKSENTDNNPNISVYSSVDESDENTLKIIITNRSIHDKTQIKLNLASGKQYETADVFALYGDSTAIRSMNPIEIITENAFEYTLEPLSVTEFIVKAETIAAPAGAEISAAESPEATAALSPETPAESNNLPAIIGIAAGAVAVAAVAAVLLIKKFRRRRR
jgi:hypothetical protein